MDTKRLGKIEKEDGKQEALLKEILGERVVYLLGVHYNKAAAGEQEIVTIKDILSETKGQDAPARAPRRSWLARSSPRYNQLDNVYEGPETAALGGF